MLPFHLSFDNLLLLNTLYYLYIKYIEEYEKCLNFVTLLYSNILEEYDLPEYEYMINWNIDNTFNLSADEYLNLILNCYKHNIKIHKRLLAETYYDNLLLSFF